ncbi:MAG: NUDIX domain-containing protein [Candidatus Paceibacterota bacterium]|jgi:predicted NUDIX family phosphoesterase
MQKEKKFKPKPGQVDFTKIRWSPVINCVLEYKGNILILERNKNMRLYPGYWNGISGFLDDDKGLKEKVYEELKEEVGINKEDVISIKVGQIFDRDESKYKKTWIVHPILVKVKTNKIKLDFENRNYKWIKLEEIKDFKLLPGFETVIKNLFE